MLGYPLLESHKRDANISTESNRWKVTAPCQFVGVARRDIEAAGYFADGEEPILLQ